MICRPVAVRVQHRTTPEPDLRSGESTTAHRTLQICNRKQRQRESERRARANCAARKRPERTATIECNRALEEDNSPAAAGVCVPGQGKTVLGVWALKLSRERPPTSAQFNTLRTETGHGTTTVDWLGVSVAHAPDSLMYSTFQTENERKSERIGEEQRERERRSEKLRKVARTA